MNSVTVKLIFQNAGEIETLADKSKPRDFITRREPPEKKRQRNLHSLNKKDMLTQKPYEKNKDVW